MDKVVVLDVEQFFSVAELEQIAEKKRLELEKKEKALQAEKALIASIPEDVITIINTKLLEEIPAKGVAVFAEELEFPINQNFDAIVLAYKRKGFYVELEREICDGDDSGSGSGPATLYIHREPPSRSCRSTM